MKKLLILLMLTVFGMPLFAQPALAGGGAGPSKDPVLLRFTISQEDPDFLLLSRNSSPL